MFQAFTVFCLGGFVILSLETESAVVFAEYADVRVVIPVSCLTSNCIAVFI